MRGGNEADVVRGVEAVGEHQRRNRSRQIKMSSLFSCEMKRWESQEEVRIGGRHRRLSSYEPRQPAVGTYAQSQHGLMNEAGEKER